MVEFYSSIKEHALDQSKSQVLIQERENKLEFLIFLVKNTEELSQERAIMEVCGYHG